MRALYLDDVDVLTRRGRFAIVRRHGDTTRLRAYIAGLKHRAIDRGTAAPTGTARFVGFGEGGPRDEWPTIADLMHLVGTIPADDRALSERVAIRTGMRSWEAVGAPAASDYDAAGVCRCGCGCERPRPPSPPSATHRAAVGTTDEGASE
jgi:hypothetical protein